MKEITVKLSSPSRQGLHAALVVFSTLIMLFICLTYFVKKKSYDSYIKTVAEGISILNMLESSPERYAADISSDRIQIVDGEDVNLWFVVPIGVEGKKVLWALSKSNGHGISFCYPGPSSDAPTSNSKMAGWYYDLHGDPEKVPDELFDEAKKVSAELNYTIKFVK